MNSNSKVWGRKRFRNELTPWCPSNCFLCCFKPFKNQQRNTKKTWNGLTGQFQCITLLRKTYSWNPYRFSMIRKFKKVVVYLNSGIIRWQARPTNYHSIQSTLWRPTYQSITSLIVHPASSFTDVRVLCWQRVHRDRWKTMNLAPTRYVHVLLVRYRGISVRPTCNLVEVLLNGTDAATDTLEFGDRCSVVQMLVFLGYWLCRASVSAKLISMTDRFIVKTNFLRHFCVTLLLQQWLRNMCRPKLGEILFLRIFETLIIPIQILLRFIPVSWQ